MTSVGTINVLTPQECGGSSSNHKREAKLVQKTRNNGLMTN
jgi:hypothetical protein